MVTSPSAVTYVGLPVGSGGAHRLGRLSRHAALSRLDLFLETCTEPIGARRFWFDVHEPAELGRVAHLERELVRRFGPLSSDAGRRRVPVSPGRASEALAFLDDIDPQPTNRYDMAPIWFWADSKIRLLDPGTGRAIPGQDPTRFAGVEYESGVPLGSSGIRLILANHASIGIELCIPDADEDLVQRTVPWLQQHLPFRLSPHHWRAWTPTRTGSFTKRKLTLPARDLRRR